MPPQQHERKAPLRPLAAGNACCRMLVLRTPSWRVRRHVLPPRSHFTVCANQCATPRHAPRCFLPRGTQCRNLQDLTPALQTPSRELHSSCHRVSATALCTPKSTQALSVTVSFSTLSNVTGQSTLHVGDAAKLTLSQARLKRSDPPSLIDWCRVFVGRALGAPCRNSGINDKDTLLGAFSFCHLAWLQEDVLGGTPCRHQPDRTRSPQKSATPRHAP